MIIWLPVLQPDKRENAVIASQEFQDPRLLNYWSADKTFGDLFGEALDLAQFAWDAYFVYESGVVWKDNEPSVPVFWMHQMGGIEDRAPTLDSTVLISKIKELTEKVR